MKEYPKAWVKEITDNYVVVICPLCGREHTYKRNHCDEGKYVQQCKIINCEERFYYEVDKHELFRGDEVGNEQKSIK